jgi:hypothetical protein
MRRTTMPKGAEYRVDFTITRRLPGEDDFTEIGFGSSGAWDSLDDANHTSESFISSREWETTADMPDPTEVDY